MVGKQCSSLLARLGSRLSDWAVTLICWTYFTLGFVLFFSLGYILAYLFSTRREFWFQRLNSLFYQFFFKILRRIAPRHQWQIDERIGDITSSVIVCNHLSYLDPLLLISLFERQKTIVKTVFFKVPIFGWVLRHSGYFPADSAGTHGQMMIEQIEKMEEYLSDGGNLFIFPEGTRSRDGTIGPLNRGALKIARLCRAPVYVLHLANTDKLFTPGRFFFHTRIANIISLKVVDYIEAGPGRCALPELENRIRHSLQQATSGTPCDKQPGDQDGRVHPGICS